MFSNIIFLKDLFKKYGRKSCDYHQNYLYATDTEKCSIISDKMSIYLHICIVNIQQGPFKKTYTRLYDLIHNRKQISGLKQEKT